MTERVQVREAGVQRLCFFTLFKLVKMADVASLRPNSVSADATTVTGQTEALRMRLRLSGGSMGFIASNTARRGRREGK